MLRKAISFKLLNLTVALAVLSNTSLMQASVRTAFPSQSPGPPTYAFLARPPIGEIFRDGDWVAIPFLRDPECIRPEFNLLDEADIPAAFGCTLTVDGFAIWKNGPPPIDPVPVFAHYSGLGSVPVWFVRWSDLGSAIDGGVLTIADLQAMPSLLIGAADIFEAVEQPGSLRPQGFGNGKIEIGAHGTLSDGRSFTFTSREMGVNQVSVQRHTKIEFK